MTPLERVADAPTHWPTAAELEQVASETTVIMLPDRVERDASGLVAAFRLDAQGLRVAAKEAGLVPILHAPAGAELAMYTENAADWVLPVIVAFVLAIPGQIGATLAADWIEGQIPQHPAAHNILYREAVMEDGALRLYEIEGAPREVVHLLRTRGLLQDGPAQQPSSRLSPTPPDHLGR